MRIENVRAVLAAVLVTGLLQACGDTNDVGPSESMGQSPDAADTPITVQTASGIVRGIELDNGVHAWLGVPYAAAPVQDLRWRPPEANHWEGIYNADRKMSECMQVLRPHNINHYFGEEATSEDCLFMNIWAPADATADSGLPVIVFIYGGGGTIGSSGMALYDGATVAERGAIFINFNYRVGLLGFMAHPQLTTEQGGHSGNYGYLDQHFALKWIHDNIAQFGGDPSKVLISGQSFGAGSVTQQIFSPLSKGLFSAALMSSGCGWGDTFGAPVTLAEGEQVGKQVEEALGVTGIAALRNIPADKIIDIQQENQVGTSTQGVRAGGVIDGYFMPATQQEILESGGNSDVPIIAHYNAHEGFGAVLPRASTAIEYKDLARQMWGDATDEFLTLFPVESDADVWGQAWAATMTQGFESRARTCAQLQTKYNASPMWISTFARKHPYKPGAQIADQDPATTGAYHTADIPYWFGTQDMFNLFRETRVWTEDDRELSRRMTQALIHLADTGSPSTEGLDWPAWSPDNEVKMLWGDVAEVVPMNVAALAFFASHTAQPVDVPDAPRVGPRD